jgi:TRAP-type C4-dicarboxylate transport system substrate-binding protein
MDMVWAESSYAVRQHNSHRIIQDPEAYHGLPLRTIPAPVTTSVCKAYRHAPGGCRAHRDRRDAERK